MIRDAAKMTQVWISPAWNECRSLTLEESEEQMNEKKGDPTNPRSKKLISASMVMLLGVSTATAQSRRDPLKRGFDNPPQTDSQQLV